MDLTKLFEIIIKIGPLDEWVGCQYKDLNDGLSQSSFVTII